MMGITGFLFSVCGEKKPETEEDPLEGRTDGSDAFDTLCIAVEAGNAPFSGGGGGGGIA